LFADFEVHVSGPSNEKMLTLYSRITRWRNYTHLIVSDRT